MLMQQKIPFIHNYCDRWCERCPFSSRCQAYEDQQQIPAATEQRQEVFIERLTENLKKARIHLESVARELGIDLAGVAERIITENDRESRAHPLATMAVQYSQLAHQWLKTQPGMLDLLDQLREQLLMGLESREEASKHTQTIRSSIEMIQRFENFIYGKIMRALLGYKENPVDELQSDYNGSAKVAALAITESVSAWENLFQLLSDQEDQFLPILSHLQRMHHALLEEFPDCMRFVRPGFDD